MFSALLIGMALTTGSPALSPDEQADYHSARERAGRDPAAHVKLALWCEAHGLNHERMKHLAIAVLSDPQNGVARGLLGLIEHDGRWQQPDGLSKRLQEDAAERARQAQYRAHRDRTSETADGQWKLALWCEANGLREAEKAHLVKVVRLDPRREAAWKRLGYKLLGGRWATPEQIAAEKQEREVQKQADRQWKSHLEKWRGWLGEKRKRVDAEKALANVTDPRAVPMVWVVFIMRGTENQKVGVQLLSQIDAPGASRGLALLAVLSRSAEVRRMATDSLVLRDPREFAGALVNMIGHPIAYEVKRANGPGSPGELFIKGKDTDYKRRYTSLPGPQITPDEQFAGFDEFGLPVASRFMGWYTTVTPVYPSVRVPTANVLNPQQVAARLRSNGVSSATSAQIGRTVATAEANATQWLSPLRDLGRGVIAGDIIPATDYPAGTLLMQQNSAMVERIPVGQQAVDAQNSAAAAEDKLNRDIAEIEAYNEPVKNLNRRLFAILTRVAGHDLGADPESWQKWYSDLLGYALQAQAISKEKETVVEEIPSDYRPQAAPVEAVAALQTVRVVRVHACFAAGTPVRTQSGLKAIETIREGDLVLSQDTTTGALRFQAVATAYHNPPNTTLKIDLGDEPVVATKIHRFWVAGKGWTMARELKPGMLVRTLGGASAVKSVTDDKTQPVFNLELVDGDSFFVGKQGMLVHDNSVVSAVLAPFDAPTALASVKTPK